MSQNGVERPIGLAVVDNDPGMRRLYEAIADSSPGKDFRIVGSFGDPVKAAKAVEGNALPSGVDVFVLDFDMPGMDGANLAARIRQKLPEVPIVLVSAGADNPNNTTVVADLLRRGVINARFGKPFDINRWEDTVSELGSKHRQMQLANQTA